MKRFLKTMLDTTIISLITMLYIVVCVPIFFTFSGALLTLVGGIMIVGIMDEYIN